MTLFNVTFEEYIDEIARTQSLQSAPAGASGLFRIDWAKRLRSRSVESTGAFSSRPVLMATSTFELIEHRDVESNFIEAPRFRSS
jgi:hypothetical protein